MTSIASPRISGAHTESTVESSPKPSTTPSPSLWSLKVPARRSAEGQKALAFRGADSPHSELIESCISRISVSVSSVSSAPFEEDFLFALMPAPPR